MSLPNTTDAAFADDVLSSETPVLVDFTAAWCGPCRMLAPVLEQIASDEAARLRVVSIDVDANPRQTANRDHARAGAAPGSSAQPPPSPVTRSAVSSMVSARS